MLKMDYTCIEQDKQTVIVHGIRNFDLTHIFECGQCFRWNRFKNGYIGIAFGKVIYVYLKDGKLFIDNCTLYEFNDIWKEYFDLERGYSQIKESLSLDKVLKKAVKFGHGIRILRQDEWECLVSFIISANNAIPRIKKSIDYICRYFGRPIKYKDLMFYTFPTVEDLAYSDVSDIKECKCGYRSDYIKRSAEMVLSGEVDLYKLKYLDYRDAREQLLKLPGVGPKVADCVLLYSMGKFTAFPTDVWVGRVMKQFYVDDDMSLKKIHDYAIDKFGELSGFAQQYLFYYARELKIGK